MTVPAERSVYVRGVDGAWTFAGEVSPPHEDAAIDDRAKAAERLRPLLHAYVNDEWRRASGVLLGRGRGLRRGLARAATSLRDAMPGRAAGRPADELGGLVDAMTTCRERLADLPEVAAGDPRRVVVRPFDASLRVASVPEFATLIAALRRLRDATGVEAVLHGSLSTDDWTGYRDADLLLLIGDDVLRSPDRLERLRRAMRDVSIALHRFDPLQHHGVFVLPAFEFDAYPEHHLPVDALACGRHLTGAGLDLVVRARVDRDAALRSLHWAMQKFRRGWLDGAPLRDGYPLKAWASVLMLMPALHETAIGAPCYKRESFARVAARMPAQQWAIQEWAAALRRDWPSPDAWTRVAARCRPALRNALVPRLSRRLASVRRIGSADVLRMAHEHASWLWASAVTTLETTKVTTCK